MHVNRTEVGARINFINNTHVFLHCPVLTVIGVTFCSFAAVQSPTPSFTVILGCLTPLRDYNIAVRWSQLNILKSSLFDVTALQATTMLCSEDQSVLLLLLH